MNITLEKKNNQVIFNRAVDSVRKCFGEPSEEDVIHIRKTLFRDTWKREGRSFQKMRHQFNKTFSELSEESNIDEMLLYKLEKGHDFKNRDSVARFLKRYYRKHIN